MGINCNHTNTKYDFFYKVYFKLCRQSKFLSQSIMELFYSKFYKHTNLTNNTIHFVTETIVLIELSTTNY